MIGRTHRDIVIPDEPPPPTCRDCRRPLRRDDGHAAGRPWRCVECGDVLHPSTIERIGAWNEIEEALDDAEEHVKAIRDIGEGSVETDAKWLGKLLDKIRDRLDTISACLVDEGVRVE